MVDQKKKTVTVTCDVVQGLVLRTYDPHDAREVTIRSGANTGIDKDFIDKWMAANSQSSVVLNGMLKVVEEDRDGTDPWDRASK